MLGEAVRALNDDSSLCATLHTVGGVGELYQRRSTLSPHQDWGRARTAGNRFACDDKELGPSWGGNYPENGLVKPPRRDTRALSPAEIFGGKAPLRLAA